MAERLFWPRMMVLGASVCGICGLTTAAQASYILLDPTAGTTLTTGYGTSAYYVDSTGQHVTSTTPGAVQEVTNRLNVHTSGGLNETIALKATTGAASGITATITDAFGAENTSGVSPTGDAQTYFKGTPGLAGDGAAVGTGALTRNANSVGVITFSNLNANATYNFILFGSRATVAGKDMTTVYQIDGTTTQSVTVDPQSNASTVWQIGGVHPKFDKTIGLTVSEGTANNYFGYLNVMRVEEVVPEPASMSLLGVGTAASLLLRRRSRTQVQS